DFLTYDPKNRLYPSNSLNNVMPALRHSVAAAIAPTNPASVNYLEPAYFNVGALGAAVTYQVQLDLGLLKGTLFEMDKSLYFGQQLFIKLFFGPLSKICYISTSNAN